MTEPRDPQPEPPPPARSKRYAAAIIILTAVVIGLCSVVGEALIPRSLPPEDAWGWSAFVLAFALFTAVFVATMVLTVFLDGITRVLARRPLRDRLAALFGRPSRIFVAAVGFGVVAIAMSQLADIGKFVKDSELGGLDLAKYCKSYGYESNDVDRCSLKIPLADACNWQHRMPGHRVEQKSGPYSATCINSKGQDVGGIRDMRAYCRYRFPMSADVDVALVNGTTWACQTKIDKSLACGWQYQKRDLAARQNGFLWTCYQ